MSDQPQEAARSAGGRERGDDRNLATRRRQAHRDEVLEKLRNAGLLQQVIADASKLADESKEIDAVMAGRIKAACDIRLKMINKWLPDVKAVEMTGEDGGPVVVQTIQRTIIDPRGA